MEDIRAHLEGVTRRYRELDEKFAEKGGLASFFGLYGRIGELLDQISTSELDLLVNEIQRAKETLNHLQEAVTPGQAAVFYNGDVCLGGGWIERILA